MTKKRTLAVSQKDGREEINPRSMTEKSVNLEVPHRRMSQIEAAQDPGETVHEFS